MYYITSKALNVRIFAGYVRKHWVIESRHWVFDNLFQEDRCRARKDNARMNASLLRKLAYDILLFRRKKEPQDHSFEYHQDELKFDLAELMRYFLHPMEKFPE